MPQLDRNTLLCYFGKDHNRIRLQNKLVVQLEQFNTEENVKAVNITIGHLMNYKGRNKHLEGIIGKELFKIYIGTPTRIYRTKLALPQDVRNTLLNLNLLYKLSNGE